MANITKRTKRYNKHIGYLVDDFHINGEYLIKRRGHVGAIYMNHIYFSEDMIGKRIKIKIEVIKDEEER